MEEDSGHRDIENRDAADTFSARGASAPSIVDLVGRLDAATEGSEELDCRIRCAVEGWRFIKMFNEQPYYYIVEMPRRMDLNVSEVPPYTRSLDAALTLVPEDAVWTVMTDYGLPGRARVFWDKDPPHTWRADGPTPALALCIAALKARLA